jgi:hypothetical protein
MPNEFLNQFMAGWQMGQGRRESQRRDQELQMEQQRQQQVQEQRAAAFQLQQEEFALRKKQLAAEEHASRLAQAKEAFQQQVEKNSLSNLPRPTAADVGVPEQGPDFAGPMASEINVPQPTIAMPSAMQGQPDVQMPVPTGRQQQEMAQAEQQRKMREALGMLDAQERIKSNYREKPKGLADIFAEAKARASGNVAGGGGGMFGEDANAENPVLDITAQGLSNYELGLSDLGRMGKGEKAIVFAKAKQLNPDFNASLYASRQKLRADFTSGKTANNIDSLNTAVDHLNTLATYADALKNGNVQLANQAAQSFATATGGAAATNYKTMATAVESEVASLLKKTGATDQEISSWRGNFSSAQSPAQLKGALNTVLKVMHGREQALQQRWKTGMGSKQEYPIYGEEQAKILEALGAKEGGTAGTIPARPPNVPPEAQWDPTTRRWRL